VFAKLTEHAPLSPLGPLFIAGNLQAEMLDRESDERRERFLANVELAESRVEAGIAGRGDRLGEDEFVLGVAAGYRAVYESRWGGWFAALKSGLRAKKHFESALRLDSTFCDAYLGLGSYHYWKSAKTDWVNWLPIVSDARSKGIVMLIRAAYCGIYTRATAHAALASAYINDGRYSEALAHADTLGQLAPDGKAHLWLQGKARYALYEWDSAIAIFAEIESRIREDGHGNYFNLIECAYYRAQCHWGAGRYQQARDECGRALTYPAPDDIKERQRKRLSELRALQRKLVRLLSKN
jgi:tetratricopeptide (TPR) repeat protein